MATARLRLFLSAKEASRNVVPSRSAVTTESGAFLEQPAKQRFGLVSAALTVIAGLTVGSSISKNGEDNSHIVFTVLTNSFLAWYFYSGQFPGGE